MASSTVPAAARTTGVDSPEPEPERERARETLYRLPAEAIARTLYRPGSLGGAVYRAQVIHPESLAVYWESEGVYSTERAALIAARIWAGDAERTPDDLRRLYAGHCRHCGTELLDGETEVCTRDACEFARAYPRARD